MTVKHSLLGLLTEKPMHGYELRDQFVQRIGDHWALNFGQIYTTLERLERDGLVTHQLVVQDSGPDKKVYEITEKGRAELLAWLGAPVERSHRLKDEFFVKLLLSIDSGLVPPEVLIQNQRKYTLQEMHTLTRLKQGADSEKEIAWLLLLDSAILHLEADIRWLDVCEHRLLKLNRRPKDRPKPSNPPASDQSRVTEKDTRVPS